MGHELKLGLGSRIAVCLGDDLDNVQWRVQQRMRQCLPRGPEALILQARSSGSLPAAGKLAHHNGVGMTHGKTHDEDVRVPAPAQDQRQHLENISAKKEIQSEVQEKKRNSLVNVF